MTGDARQGAADRGEYRQAAGVAAMSELLQFIIVVGFGALCFGCGYLTGVPSAWAPLSLTSHRF